MVGKKTTLTKKELEHILWAYVKAEYKPTSDIFKFLANINADGLSGKEVKELYYDKEEVFKESGKTPLDPLPTERLTREEPLDRKS